MARVNRKPKRRSAGYDEHHVRHLLEGVYLCWGHGFATAPRDEHGDFTDREAMRQAWEIMRKELLARWIAEHPGTRPFAWWEFDAPERRQRIDGVQHPFDNRVRRKRIEDRSRTSPSFAKTAYLLFYGRPRCLMEKDDFEAKYETEAEYLNRLGLLTADERKELFL